MRWRLLCISASSVVASSALVAISSCTVDGVDLAGKACPCTAGYVCDPATNVCVVSLPPALPASPDAGSSLPPSLVARSLTSPWQTTSVIRWDFQIEGKASDFLSYELAWADSLDKLESGVGDTVLGSAQRPELGAFDGRGGRVTGPVDVWTTTGVGAGKTFYAKLTATDRNRVTSSVTATATTRGPTTESRILFDDTAVPSATPAGFQFVAKDAHYAFTASCASGAPSCAEDLRLTGFKVDLNGVNDAGVFTAEDFAGAFLDVRMDRTVPTPDFSAAVGIEVANCNGSREVCQWRFSGWTQPASTSVSVQVPLSALENAVGKKLTYEALQQGGFLVSALVVAGSWPDKSTFRLYSAAIRW